MKPHITLITLGVSMTSSGRWRSIAMASGWPPKGSWEVAFNPGFDDLA
jgi:hypothetical protein